MQNRKGAKRTTTNESSIQIDAFFVAVLRVAARKYDVATAKEQGFAELHVRLDHFVKTHVIPNVGSVFEANHDQLKGCTDDEVLVLLGRARRLTKLAMTSCLLRRPPTLEQTLDVRYLTAHMHKWDLLCPTRRSAGRRHVRRLREADRLRQAERRARGFRGGMADDSSLTSLSVCSRRSDGSCGTGETRV